MCYRIAILKMAVSVGAMLKNQHTDFTFLSYLHKRAYKKYIKNIKYIRSVVLELLESDIFQPILVLVK